MHHYRDDSVLYCKRQSLVMPVEPFFNFLMAASECTLETPQSHEALKLGRRHQTILKLGKPPGGFGRGPKQYVTRSLRHLGLISDRILFNLGKSPDSTLFKGANRK